MVGPASAAFADAIVAHLGSIGVQDVVVCPGGRNAFLLQSLLRLKNGQIQVHYHYDERSAGFFGLGRAKATRRPVAIIVTSGTAAGELVPACMEAYFSGLPVIFITADRPRRFTGSGAPQTANQAGLLSRHTRIEIDLDENDPLSLEWDCAGPTHWNVRFEDPNRPETAAAISPFMAEGRSVPSTLDAMQNPLVLVGELNSDEREVVRQWLESQACSVLCEPLSCLREASFSRSVNLRMKSLAMISAKTLGRDFDGVLRIGGVPTLRLWRDLEDSLANLPIVNFSRLLISGLGRSSVNAFGELKDVLPNRTRPVPDQFLADLAHLDRAQWEAWMGHLSEYPASEPAVIRDLSRALPADAHLFLGNSLPIREWDASALFEPNERTFTGSRGLNGIDGQVSAFLGGIQPNRPNFAILGDLGFLYDFSGFWASHRAAVAPNQGTVIVINNGGGRIFDAMFREAEFQNQHALSFEEVARFWNRPYHLFEGGNLSQSLADDGGIIEIRPDHAQTRALGDAWKQTHP